MAHTYYIALGSNLGDREASIRRAWQMLEAHGVDVRLSSIYESEPMYVTDQPLFLNAVGMMHSSLDPRQMLVELHRVESALGRDRSREKRMGPRTIDLDILLCGSLLVNEPDLIVPHPRMAERGFVLVPLLELSPELLDPGTGTPFAQALPGNTQGVYSYPRR
ncbi:MAG TPA: 2-amino-4-hydroxy-6-hydroxymethyldihydropteridine diphosphokinase [Spirochaetia bacterium]|nr:2-amino-4-hydroxy-6-hydroxymethyldihydropteridine diphosphokinase [Spirochaetia bacterium]